MLRKLGYLLTAALAAIWLTACGGGGGGSSSTTTDTGTTSGDTTADGGGTTTDTGGTTSGDTTADSGGTTSGGTSSGGSTSGGSGTVTVSGIELPSEMSVVTAKDTTATTASVHTAALADTTGFAADSDYNLTPTHLFAYDPSVEPLSTVNMILCLMDQTRASDMVNQGPYIALVNEDACETGSAPTSSATQDGQSNNSTKAKTLNRWTVESTRQDNNSPMIVKIWVPGKPGATDPMDAERILVEVNATEGVSDTKPFGAFTMNFLGEVDASAMGGTAGTTYTTMKGMLATVDNTQGQPQFRFVEADGQALDSNSPVPFAHQGAANVVLDDATGDAGVARTYTSDSDPQGGTHMGDYVVAFNATNMLRGEDTNGDQTLDASTCLSRVNFNTQIWRYNLYHAADGTYQGQTVTAGQLVEMNSGFPFHYTKSDGSQGHGYIGFWGPWLEDGSTLADGTTIVRDAFGPGATEESYTVHVSDGKLTHRMRQEVPITQVVGQQLWYWGPYPLSPSDPNYDSSLANNDQWAMEVDGTTYDFQIVGSVTWSENGPPSVTPLSQPIVVTPQTDGETLYFGADGLGGGGRYVHDSTVAPADRVITVDVEEQVALDDPMLANGGTTLYCYDRCIKGGLTQADIDAMTSEQDLYYSTFDPTTGQLAPHAYTAQVVNGKLTLSDDNGEVSLNGLDLSPLGITWGLQTGDLVPDTTGITDPWMVFSLPEAYRWTTSSNDWDHAFSLVDASGNPVTFDQPLHFSYTLEAADEENGDPNGLAGTAFMLDYDGPGELHGFPWFQDPVTQRWYSQVTLKSGVLLTDLDGNQFVVKQVDGEQAMREDTSGGCDTLNVDSLFADPALTLPTPADIGDVSFTWDDRPTVTDAPAVIEGEIQ